ncbi:MAG: hypothetical protein N3A57_05035, partial [Negativicutes bacterium]|nr:hypothetical protein [Negativicutes bacterium]
PGQPFDQIVSNAPNLATCKLIHGDGGLSKAPFYAMVITAKAGREDSEDVAYTWKSFSKGSDSVCADRSIDKEPQKLNFAFFGQMVIKGTFGTHTYRYGLAQGNQMGAFNNWWFTFAGGAQRKGDCLVSPDGAYVVSRLKTGGEDNAFLISYNRAIIGT